MLVFGLLGVCWLLARRVEGQGIAHSRKAQTSDIIKRNATSEDLISLSNVVEYSFLHSNPRTLDDLWSLIANVTNVTRAALFNPSSTLLGDAIPSDSTQALDSLLNQIFANELFSETQKADRETIANSSSTLGEPSDPSNIDHEGYRENFYHYRREGILATRDEVESLWIFLVAGLDARMHATATTPASTYRQERFVVSGSVPYADYSFHWSYRKSGTNKYEDILRTIQLFGLWANEWDDEFARVVPGTSLKLYKQGTQQYNERGRGSCVFERRAAVAEIPTS